MTLPAGWQRKLTSNFGSFLYSYILLDFGNLPLIVNTTISHLNVGSWRGEWYLCWIFNIIGDLVYLSFILFSPSIYLALCEKWHALHFLEAEGLSTVYTAHPERSCLIISHWSQHTQLKKPCYNDCTIIHELCSLDGADQRQSVFWNKENTGRTGKHKAEWEKMVGGSVLHSLCACQWDCDRCSEGRDKTQCPQMPLWKKHVQTYGSWFYFLMASTESDYWWQSSVSWPSFAAHWNDCWTHFVALILQLKNACGS